MSALRAMVPRAPLSAALPSGSPVPPKQDPWYAPTDGWQAASPGQVLRVRVAQGQLGLTLDGLAAAYNILYRTTDSNAQPSWAVTTLLIPGNASTESRSLLSYQIPYDSADLDAGPSYTLSQFAPAGKTPLNCVSEIEGALAAGYYVTVPDYEGPLASFTAGVISGQATLDAVRASVKSDLGLPGIPEAKYALWGYSGGALASEWAAELQVTYAPELGFSGAALGGLTPDTFSVFNTVTSTYSAGLIPPGIVGLVSQFPEAEAFLLGRLKTAGKYNRDKFLSVLNLTLQESAPQFAFENIYDYFVGGEANFENPLVAAVLDSNGRMGRHGVPRMPLFVYKAIRDEVSPVADTDALVEGYCAAGATIAYDRNTLTTHKDEQDAESAGAFAFLQSVLSGTYVPPEGGCVVRNVSIANPNKPPGATALAYR
ncbi:secretory lipase-domain-containing protein [Truncatella angustata]|uniref:Secretory lipase-domain-containing protein n=1 Tax=Truncatella angustata TaxID=152316 RepID=A0A9P9A096_9PEZI|nr:secretory lipase-domain-containing protein [Truncatella angustata]KAH6655885.1 secretory lipase-domain-containing protein [Truncatella angustata]